MKKILVAGKYLGLYNLDYAYQTFDKLGDSHLSYG